MKRTAFVSTLFLAMSLFVFTDSMIAHSNETSGEPQEIVEVEEVETVQATTEPGASEMIGRLHPALVHFPVAWLVILVIFEIVTLRSKDTYWSRASFVILFLTVLSFIPAMTTGFMLEETASGGPGFHDLLELHETLNIIAACIIGAGFLIQLFLVKDDSSVWKKVYFGCVLVCAGIILYSAHVGGQMVFGENYFPF